MSNSTNKLLVTGASGQLGQRVLELLIEAGEKNIIAVTRSPEKLSHFAAQGVEVRAGDFDNPTSLESAFQGANRLLLISTDATGVPGQRLQQHVNAVKAAAAAGISHVIYTSLTGADNSSVLLAPDHAGTEKSLAESNLGYTILRNNVYGDMLIDTLKRAIQFGGLYSAVADGKIAYVLREDCAQAAAAALASDFEGKRILDITGADSLSQADLAAIASEIAGKEIPYVPLTLETLIDNMANGGLPRPVAEIFASFDTAAAKGELETVTNTVEELTGHQPTRVADFLKEHAAALRG